MVYMGDDVKDKLGVAHDEADGQWELRNSMRHDELGDMGHLVPMGLEVYNEHGPHFLKIAYHYKAILNLQN
jgi:hypothetical protein